MARVGTLAWANETEGRLTRKDRLALLVAQGVPAKLEEQVGRLLKLLGRERRTDRARIQAQGVDVHIPATAIARAADELVEKFSQPWLRAHSHRTFVLGALLGGDLLFDSEMLFVASMLHTSGSARPSSKDPIPASFPVMRERTHRASPSAAPTLPDASRSTTAGVQPK